jgi:PleD family two-component response regulator
MRRTLNSAPSLDLARVLVAHSQLAARLTLQTILQAGGYAVDVAATSSEAVALLDKGKYELVLTGGDPGLRAVLAYARVKDYRPATANVISNEPVRARHSTRSHYRISIRTENVPHLLGRVADLIGLRATRRYRPMGQTI